MNLAPKFCGKCGNPVKEEGAHFCGECGTAIEQPQVSNEQPKPRPRRVNPPPKTIKKQEHSQPERAKSFAHIRAAAKSGPESLLSKNSITSGWQWAVVWFIGWLPIGVLFSGFYDRIRAGNPEFYSQYPRTWGTTLPGMLTSFGIGSFLGGFFAGILIYRILKEKKLDPGILGTIPAIAWALLWGTVLSVMTLALEEYMDDGTLIITVPIFAMIFGGLIVAGLANLLLEKKYAFSITNKDKKSIAIGWAACSFFGVIVGILF